MTAQKSLKQRKKFETDWHKKFTNRRFSKCWWQPWLSFFRTHFFER